MVLRNVVYQDKRNLNTERWVNFRSNVQTLRDYLFKKYQVEPTFQSGDTILINNEYTLEDEDLQKLRELIFTVRPWRIGPYQLFNVLIDSEWQSGKRWERMASFIPQFKSKCIADVGCNSGYFMFRSLKYEPEIILGIDPYDIFYHQFFLLKSFCPHFQSTKLCYELLGVNSLTSFPDNFDFVFYMGVIYHRRDPISTLVTIYNALKQGGSVLVETIALDTLEPVVLSPPGRYAKMRNVWFVPSETALFGWLKRSGFRDMKTVYSHYVSHDEQRKSEFSFDQSLTDYLDPEDTKKTIEGYQAPYKIGVLAYK
jgi:tRNA (mo5U34)-methyltransferase